VCKVSQVLKALVFPGFMCIWFGAAWADYTSIGGTLLEDMVLESNETYLVSSKLLVPQDKTLTVKPGAIVKLNTAITIKGRLVVQGDEDRPAILTVASDNSIGEPVSRNASHQSIFIESNSTSELSNAEVRSLTIDTGSSEVTLSNLYFKRATTSREGGISGGLTPNISVDSVSFSSDFRNAGYYVTTKVVTGNESMPDLGIPYIVKNGIEIAGAGSLSIDANVEIKMSGRLMVHGLLKVNGEVGRQVAFAGPSDHRYISIEPDINGLFEGVYFGPNSHSSSIKHAVFAITNMTGRVFEFDGTSVLIENSLVDALSRSNAPSSALFRVVNEASPVINCTAIRTTSTGTFYAIDNKNELQEVDALEVYWGHPFGPTLPGGETRGGIVSDKVNVEPYRGSMTDSCSIDPPSYFLLDVDGDGEINPIVDGVLISRYMSGLRGADLVEGLNIPGSAARRDALEIESYLDWMVARSPR